MISILPGLGLTELPTRVRQLVRARRRVRTSWLPVAWAGGIFLTLVQFRWAYFRIVRAAVPANFFGFVVLPAVLLYRSRRRCCRRTWERRRRSTRGRTASRSAAGSCRSRRGAGCWRWSGSCSAASPCCAARAFHAGILLLAGWPARGGSARVHAAASLLVLALFTVFVVLFTPRLAWGRRARAGAGYSSR